ncbi:hypothetical protein DPMN_194471 [Dreissena polymorpha]|uniref:Uncharacterized protein n=1 Tax=Dreissena polymorpha TaxID=45954 RepID=A0A9D3XY96_DREPO|nr:hypothetical protein DPMN_194471 [Dreissena polymorpha]
MKIKDATSDGNLLSTQDHYTPAKLTAHVDDHKHRAQEVTTAPRDVHVVPLLTPLFPHSVAVLEECADQAESGHVW